MGIMNLERGFRRITTVVSLAVIGCGAVLSILLIWASISAWDLNKERERTLISEGCQPEEQKETTKMVQVIPLDSQRWRVTIPENDYTTTLVVRSQEKLSLTEVVRFAQAPPSEYDKDNPDLARKHPIPGIEVIDCTLEEMNISRGQRETALSSRLLYWWIGHPLFLYSSGWIISILHFNWVFAAVTILSPIILSFFVAALLWMVFYLIRWIASGFRAA